MEALHIRSLRELDGQQRKHAVHVFVESFYQSLRFFSEDTQVLVDALCHSFLSDHYYAGMLDERVVGIAACSTASGRSHKFDQHTMIAHLGQIKGRIGYHALRAEFARPIALAAHQCYIESMATDPAYRGKGIAVRMLTFVLALPGYHEYLLEVADTNVAAITLYEKLGFEVFQRKQQRFFRKRAGFDERLYMRKTTQ